MLKIILATALAVSMSTAQSQSPTIKKVDAEIDCLAQVTYHESRGEPDRGKIAVAQVALNRVKSGEYPDSVCAVVRQRSRNTCQFSWVCENKRVNKKSEDFRRERKLAAAVYHGKVDDVARGATHFHNRTVKPSWARKFKLTARIGNHFFYRDHQRETSKRRG